MVNSTGYPRIKMPITSKDRIRFTFGHEAKNNQACGIYFADEIKVFAMSLP